MRTLLSAQLVIVYVAVLFASGCGPSTGDADGGCSVGSEGCSCTTGGACDGFLLCIAGGCVDPTAPFDSGPPRDSGPSDASVADGGVDAGGVDAGPPCALATSSLPPVDPTTELLFPATDHSYWRLFRSSSTIEFHDCRGLGATLTFPPHPTYGAHTSFYVSGIDGGNTIRVSRAFGGGERLTEIYDSSGAVLSSHSTLLGLTTTDGTSFDLDTTTNTIHSVDAAGTERNVAFDPALSGATMVSMTTGGVFVSARDRGADVQIAFAWDGVSTSVGSPRILTPDLCTADPGVTYVGELLGAFDPDNFYFLCTVDGFSSSGRRHEIVQVVDGTEACVAREGASAPQLGLSVGGSGVDAAGNLWAGVLEAGTDGITDFTGTARVERGTCAYRSRLVPSEYMNLGGACGTRVMVPQLRGVTETMAWSYNYRSVACATDDYDWPYERIRLGASGALEAVP